MTGETAIALSIVLPLAAAYLLNQWLRRDLAEQSERAERARRRAERRIEKLAPLSNSRRRR